MRGDGIGYNRHKYFEGEKTVAIVDRNINLIAPHVQVPGNKNESSLFAPAMAGLKKISALVGINLIGTVMSLDGVYDSRKKRKLIFNSGMVPNIPENKRNRKKTKRNKKRLSMVIILFNILRNLIFYQN